MPENKPEPSISESNHTETDAEENARQYWRANITLMLSLLAIWFVASFVCGILLFDVLNQIQFFGWKLGFWFSQQGSIYVFVLLIFFYVWKMNRLDIQYGVDEED